MKKILFLLLVSFTLKAQDNTIYIDSIKISKVIEFLKNNKNMKYDIEYLGKSLNIDSIIRNKKGVCIHYSVYFKYLCDKLKIKNNIISAIAPVYVDKKFISNYCESVGKKKGEFNKAYTSIYEKYFSVKYPTNKSSSYTFYVLHTYNQIFFNNKTYIIDFATHKIEFGNRFFSAEYYYKMVLPICVYFGKEELKKFNLESFGNLEMFKSKTTINTTTTTTITTTSDFANYFYFSGSEVDTSLQLSQKKTTLKEFFINTKFE